ncbi:uncharacterized protein LOC122529857 isoform X2 [Frieseomelitta varia]|uniref:uncharacterized protein LOC122529857 isoform X2 n=1 Tax=Frieseomelitta varia TaxID=561572 RepID=UPI001CB6AF6C|nr:uncharacterized protein LOC122529857 isoform X2 [Frieseomelitta varia]
MKNLWIQPLKICSITTESNSENVKFSKSKSSILQLINTSGLKQLSQFIEASHAKTIISIRKKDGLYKSLNDLSLRTEINNDVLAKFYQTISNEIPTHIWSKYITPNKRIFQMPATTLAIHVGPSAINWTVVNCDFKILDWDSRVWRNETSNITTYDTINLIASVTQQLPVCNCYVMEEIKMIKNKSSNLLIQNQINTGIASCLKLITNQGTNNSSKNRLYLLKSFASARYFHLTIGSEAVSTDYIMKKILSDTDVDDEILQRVNVDEKLKRKYNKMFTDEKEQIGWSVLKALTFMCIVDRYNKYV